MPAVLARLSLRGKVLISGVSIVLLISLFIFLYYPHRQRQATVAAVRERATSLAGMLALGVGIGLELNEFQAITAAFDWARRDPSLAYIVVVDTAGEVFASYNPKDLKLEVGEAAGATGAARDGDNLLRTAAPITLQGRDHGTLLLGMSLDLMQAQIARDRLTALVISLLILGAGAALSLFFAARIAEPIVLLQQATDAISRGQYDVRVPPGGPDEVGALSAAFSLMVQRIRESITQLAAQKEALATHQQFLRQIVDANPHLIFVKDWDGKFALVNKAAAQIHDTTPERMTGSTDAEFHADPEEAERSRSTDREVMSSLRPTFIPEERVTDARNGSTRWFETVKVPLVSPDGTARQVLCVATEITQRRELEVQLRQAQKMEAIGQLTGGIAHDLNNVLTALQANADLIANALPQELRELRSDATELQTAAKRGATMVRKLLAFSRREMLALQPVSLSTLVADLSVTLRRLLPASIEIRLVAEDGSPAVRADAGAVEQMVFNLATNARDAMPGSGLLDIETRRAWLDEESRQAKGWGEPGEYVCLSVSDTGVGMDAATQAKVFEPFFTTKPPGAGTGLGMAMVYGLMKQHGGFVDLYSEPGQGTTVKLYFPALREAAAERPVPPPLPSPSGGSETILVAEDEEPIRRAAKRVLERFGYRVLLAEDGEAALRLFRAHEAEIALIISDMIMPKLGGRDLYERLRQDGKMVPFLFSSGYTARDVRESTALDPSLPFLHKPWTLTELALRVREVLDGNKGDV